MKQFFNDVHEAMPALGGLKVSEIRIIFAGMSHKIAGSSIIIIFCLSIMLGT